MPKVPRNRFAEWECSGCQHQNSAIVGNGNLECEACGDEFSVIVIPPKMMKSLNRIMDHEHLTDWLSKPNPAFDGKTPIELIESGQTDRIWKMIYKLESGQPC